jgi:hypothetical protein
VRAIWSPESLPPTRALPRAADDLEDLRATEVLGSEPLGRLGRSVEYPPAESDPTPAYGWGQSAGRREQQADEGGKRRAAGRRDKSADAGRRDQRRVPPREDEAPRPDEAPDPRLAQTRLDAVGQREPAADGGYQDGEYQDGGYQAEHGHGADGGYREEVRSEHDAIAEMDDEPDSAPADGKGIPLSWDDD